MSEMSDYLENALLDHALGTTTLALTADVFLALFTSDPTDDGSGTEVSGNGYARQTMAMGSAVGGIASNTAAESFTASGGNFGTVTHAAIFDALTVGNLLFHTPLDAPEVVNDGGTLTFAIGDVDVQLS